MMDIEAIKKRFKEIIKGSTTEKSIEKRANELETILKRDVQRGKYPELKDIGADLKDVAYILTITEHEVAFVKKVIQKRKDFKNYQTLGKRLEKNRIKILFLERSGKDMSFKDSPEVEERIHKQKKIVEQLKKYPEWYLDRAILDLGSYFEVISLPGIKQTENRRQYELIAQLLYDFDLFKQEFSKKKTEDEERDLATERVKKRAEAIPAKKWKERIQAEKERLQKYHPSPSIKR